MRLFGSFGAPWLYAAVLGAGMSLASFGPAAAADETAIVALPVVSLSFAPFFVADAAGLYAKHNLDVETRMVAGAGAANAVVSGSADFSASSSVSLMRAVAKGAPLIAIGQTQKNLEVRLIASKKLLAETGLTEKSPFEDRVKALKGKVIAVDSVSGMPDGVLRYMLAQVGLDREELQVTPMQPDAMLAGLATGTVDGIIFNIPTTIQAEVDGNAVLVEAPAEESAMAAITPFAAAVIVANPKTCEARPKVCSSIVAAIKEAQELIVARPDEAAKLLKKAFPAIADEVMARAIQITAGKLNPETTVSQQGFANAEKLSLEVGFITEAERIKPLSKLYTNDYVK